jgi:hypothetical protein
MPGVYPRRREDNTWRDIGGEVVILNEDGTQICLLNKTGAMIWALADGTKAVDELSALMCERFDVEPHVALAHAREFSIQLREAGLVDLSALSAEVAQE